MMRVRRRSRIGSEVHADRRRFGRGGGVAGGVKDKGENCRRFEIFYLIYVEVK